MKVYTPVHTVRTVCTPVHTGANRQDDNVLRVCHSISVVIVYNWLLYFHLITI